MLLFEYNMCGVHPARQVLSKHMRFYQDFCVRYTLNDTISEKLTLNTPPYIVEQKIFTPLLQSNYVSKWYSHPTDEINT